MLEIDVGVEDKISSFADLALKNRLYVSGWMLSQVLIKARAGKSVCEKISIAKLDGKPVGVAIMNKNKDVQLFVRKNSRKKGIGSKLIKSLGEKELKGNYGVIGSLEFFDKMGISYPPQ